MIDWDRVREVCTDFGEAEFAEVVTVFITEARESMDRLARTDAPDTMRAEFHFMKGAAMTLGFDEIAQICTEGEERAETGQDCSLQKALVLQRLPATCDAFLAQWRSRTSGGQVG